MPLVVSFYLISVRRGRQPWVRRIVSLDEGGLMTAHADTDTAPSHRWLRLLLVLVAALEFLDALSGVQNVFIDYHHDTTLLRFAQALASINLALAPLLAGAALIFTALGKIRYAVLALAALTLGGWVLSSLPSMRSTASSSRSSLAISRDFSTISWFP